MDEYIDIDNEVKHNNHDESIMNQCNNLLSLYGYIPEGNKEAGEITTTTYNNGKNEAAHYVPYDNSVTFSYDTLAIEEAEDSEDLSLNPCKSPDLLCKGIPIVFNQRGRVMVFCLDKDKSSVKYDEPEALFNNSYDRIKNALSQTERRTHSVWADIMQYFSSVPSKFNDIEKTLTDFNRLGKLTPESNIKDYMKSINAIINATNRYTNYKSGQGGFEAHNKNGASDIENRRLDFAKKVRQFADEKMQQLELVAKARITLREYNGLTPDEIKNHIKMEYDYGGMSDLCIHKKSMISQLSADPIMGHQLEYSKYRMEDTPDIIKNTFNNSVDCLCDEKTFENSKKTYRDLLADMAGSMIAFELLELEKKKVPEYDSGNLILKNEIDADVIRNIGIQAINFVGKKEGVHEINTLVDCKRISSRLFACELIYNADFIKRFEFNRHFSSRVNKAINGFINNNADNSYVKESADILMDTRDRQSINFNSIAAAGKLHDTLNKTDKQLAENIIVSMVMMNVFSFDKKLSNVNAPSALNELAANKTVSLDTFEQSTRDCLPENMLDTMTYAGLFRFVSDAEKQNSIAKEVCTKISGKLCKKLGVKQDAVSKEAEKADTADKSSVVNGKNTSTGPNHKSTSKESSQQIVSH